MEKTLEQKLWTQLTVSVPEGGKAIADLSRNASYEAAKTGMIGPVPVIEVRGKKRLPTAPIRRTLGLDQQQAA
jgi:hypothetical protein